jgi:hypothetical protein
LRRLISFWCLFVLVFAAHSLSGLSTSSAGLPDAPSPQAQNATASSQADPTTSSIAGTVEDLHGAPISGVVVTVTGVNDNAETHTATVDSAGAFTISGLAAGIYQVTIMLPGQSPQVATVVTLGSREERVLPIATSRHPRSSTTVHVDASINQVATAQVKIEEKQRVLGVVPNFYTSYIWNSAPLTPKLKFKLALRAEIDPIEFATDAGVAGVEQWHNTFPGYGRGWQGYGKRFGSAYADSVIGAFLGRATLPSIFHQDPRYFYRGTGSVGSRVFYALAQTFVTRGDNGDTEVNYSHLLGNFLTAGISNVYRAPSDRTASITFRDAGIVTAGDAAGNLLREFLSRPFTTNVPKFAKGKQSN